MTDRKFCSKHKVRKKFPEISKFTSTQTICKWFQNCFITKYNPTWVISIWTMCCEMSGNAHRSCLTRSTLLIRSGIVKRRVVPSELDLQPWSEGPRLQTKHGPPYRSTWSASQCLSSPRPRVPYPSSETGSTSHPTSREWHVPISENTLNFLLLHSRDWTMIK